LAAKFFSETSLKRFSEPEAGEAARGCGTAVDQDRKDRKEKDLFTFTERSAASSWGTPQLAGPPGRRMQQVIRPTGLSA
jgi:hypothetical protein